MPDIISRMRKSGWRKPLAFGLVLVFVAVLMLFSSWRRGPGPAVFDGQEIAAADTIDADAFIYLPTFDATVAAAQAEAKDRTEACGDIRGGVVNHHILAADLIASFFAELARCRPTAERIIILSPDHFHQGQAPIVTHAAMYRTQQDPVAPDAEMIGRLLAHVPSARDEAPPFPNEHGIGALVPFLHKTLPKARVIPVLISGRATNASVKALSDWLSEELKNPTTFVVVSSDMSHYLPEAQAETNDRATMRAFEKNDAEFFWQADDDFTDNGKSLWTVITAFASNSPPSEGGVRGGWSPGFRLFKTAISTEYGGPTGYTTSYLTGFWVGRAACPAGACE